MSLRTRVTAAVAAALTSLSVLALPAQAVVPVDPGPIAAGRPITGSTQNLPSIQATQPYNIGPGFASTVTAYYTSGQLVKDQQDVADAAEAWVRKVVKKQCDGKPKSCKAMVVFDIDDTLMNTYAVNAANTPAFSYDTATQDTAIADCTMPPNAPVVALYQRLRKQGLAIGIVTGRPDTLAAASAACLNTLGVAGWYQLVTRTPADASLSAAVYKARQRALWEKQGFKIVASIGDQVSDMAGGHVMHGFLLPNTMYFLP